MARSQGRLASKVSRASEEIHGLILTPGRPLHLYDRKHHRPGDVQDWRTVYPSQDA
jgi:hypothetical protein